MARRLPLKRKPLLWALGSVLLAAPLVGVVWALVRVQLSFRAGYGFGCGAYTFPCASWWPVASSLLDAGALGLLVLLGVRVYRSTNQQA